MANDSGIGVLKYTYRRERLATGRWGHGECYNDAAYDSVLLPKHGANAELTLTLKIKFTPLDPHIHGSHVRDANNENFAISKWDPSELVKFKLEASRQANALWNNQLWLIPPIDFDLFDYHVGRRVYRPSVKCTLNCVESLGQFHAEVKLAHLKYDSDVPVPIIRPLYKRGSGSFRSNALLWCNLDIGMTVGHIWHPIYQRVEQWAIPHEVGHLLGLQHIGRSQQVKTCIQQPRGPSPPACYGDAKDAAAWMARDIMGMGKEVNICNTGPWRNAIQYHTFWPDDEWRAVRDEMPLLDVTQPGEVRLHWRPFSL